MGFIITSFSLPDLDENRNLLKEAKVLAAKDGWSFSQIVKEALGEYVKRHSPGNPQMDVRHWTESMPLPETLKHRHTWRFEAGTSGTLGRHVCDCGERRR